MATVGVKGLITGYSVARWNLCDDKKNRRMLFLLPFVVN